MPRSKTGEKPPFRLKVNDKQWAFVQAQLEGVSRNKRRRRPSADPRLVFDTILAMLWREIGFHDVRDKIGGKGENKICGNTVWRTLWAWSEDGCLEKAWTAYLKAAGPGIRRKWRDKLDRYANSWSDRKLAGRFASRVHTRWFHQIYEGTQIVPAGRKRIR